MKIFLPCLAVSSLASTATEAFVPPARSSHVVASSTRGPVLFAQNTEGFDKGPMPPGTHEELMYALGVNLARQLGDVRPLVKEQNELNNVAQGLLDVVMGRLSDAGQRGLLASRGQELNQLISERANEIRERLTLQGMEMLREMAENQNAEYLESGVVVHKLEPGRQGGARPTTASSVRVHYHGTLCDGTVFDSTLDGEPVVFPLNGVIPGWRDALLRMHEGETCMIGIPPDEAYGAEGTPDGRIPPGSTLFFKVQLLEVMSAGVGGDPKLVDASGNRLGGGGAGGGGGLMGADGRPIGM